VRCEYCHRKISRAWEGVYLHGQLFVVHKFCSKRCWDKWLNEQAWDDLKVLMPVWLGMWWLLLLPTSILILCDLTKTGWCHLIPWLITLGYAILIRKDYYFYQKLRRTYGLHNVVVR
jgi:hypothetical protein